MDLTTESLTAQNLQDNSISDVDNSHDKVWWMMVLSSFIATLLTAIALNSLLSKKREENIKKRFPTHIKHMIFISTLVLIASIYTTIVAPGCLEVRADGLLKDILTYLDWTICIALSLFGIIGTILMIGVMDFTNGQLVVIIASFILGFTIFSFECIHFILPLHNQLNYTLFGMLCLDVITAFILFPTAVMSRPYI